MSFTLIFTEEYEQRAKRFVKKHPELKAQYTKTIEFLSSNPYHPSLRLHALRGKLQGLHSVSINLNYRLTIKLLILESEIVLIDIGNHDQVY